MEVNEMGRKIGLIGLSLFFVVTTMVIAGGIGETEPVVQEQKEVGAPQYGGEFTMITFRVAEEPPTWDIYDGSWALLTYQNPFMETLLLGDVEKYGPRGTNEYDFALKEYVPDRFLGGLLAESWELTSDPLGIRFSIRPGCMFYDNPRVGFKAREFTAYDAAFCLNRYREGAQGPRRIAFVKEGGFEALDKYTLQVHFDYYSADWPLRFAYGYFCTMYPPELVQKGLTDWRNQSGTGPFILRDVVEGSNVTYERNPNWWNKEVSIQGKTYDSPFIDKLIFPIIFDESTRIAAIRTGKVDLAVEIPFQYKDTLAKTSPDLIIGTYRAGEVQSGRWNCAPGKLWGNKNLRRAMQIGTDIEAIVNNVFSGEADIQSQPFSAATQRGVYTPIEELPKDTKLLFDYNQDLARQMIIDEGYPNGLTLKIDYSAGLGVRDDTAAMLANMWQKIGVKVILQPRDDATFESLKSSGWEDLMLTSIGNAGEVLRADSYRLQEWDPYYADEWFKTQIVKAASEMDESKRNAMLKELGIYCIDGAGRLPLGTPYLLKPYWRWVKNYYGEVEAGFTNYSPMLSRLWIDQELKKALTK
jgi:peptide/nickel transport system substrate-binding protein